MRPWAAPWRSMQTVQGTTALLLLLVWAAAVPHVHSAVTNPQGIPDSAPAPQLPKAAAAPEQARECLLRAFKTPNAHLRERKVFSQYGEDGILESIFGCIGTTDRYFVEFGVEDGSECTTRNLRETHGFSGLMMDGSNSRPEINLQQEMMFSHNIVQLFQKHKVPHPGFDHLTVDIDQNTFWVALEVLRAGYRPRSLAAEMNRNLAWSDSYATIDMPEEMAFFRDACGNGCYQLPRKAETGDCYFGASTTAWAVMLRSFGYHLVYSDAAGVNAFFVHESVVGSAPLFSIPEAKQYFTNGGEYPALHGHCMRRPWVAIDTATNYSDPALDVNSLPVVFLSHTAGGERFQQRLFYEVELSSSLQEQLRGGLSGGLKTRLELGRGRAPAGASRRGGPGGVGAGAAYRPDRGMMLETWSVAALVVVAFVCGGLLQRFGGRLLYASSSACRGNRHISM
ncbi:hypothetical protein COO60DRAFT_478397 [Scenedesmus sp. NREL 46B-D3]|nr:hypothetical protein COO60DRAFT_478397 [Scenedesmus sp. NREL 46B-D3]